MIFDKFDRLKKIIIIGSVVLIAVIGVVSFAFTSATDKKGAPPGVEKYPSAGANNPVATVADRQDATLPGKLEITDNVSKVVLRVNGMSCSGCIYTIKSSLSEFKGIRDILVNLSAGQTEVYYDNTQLKDVNRIADAITASGYPAKITEILSADQIRKERDLGAARSLSYIAAVGEWDIARNDFNTELEHAKKRYALSYGNELFTTPRGSELIDNLKAQIASQLIDEGLQMQEIQGSGFKIDAAVVNVEFQQFLKQKGIGIAKFKADLKNAGYGFDYFMKKFGNRVLINTYLENKILGSATNTYEKQRRYATWFNNAKLLARVVYYDKEIERLVQAKAAGSGCSGGSSCSAKR
jgi:copper chaperone